MSFPLVGLRWGVMEFARRWSEMILDLFDAHFGVVKVEVMDVGLEMDVVEEASVEVVMEVEVMMVGPELAVVEAASVVVAMRVEQMEEWPELTAPEEVLG